VIRLADNPPTQYLTPPQLAKRWGVNTTKVLGWVRSGELRAVNLAARRDGRPRWRVPIDAVLEFEAVRAAPGRGRPSTGRQRRKHPEVIENFSTRHRVRRRHGKHP
jgi:hypothetical protein